VVSLVEAPDFEQPDKSVTPPARRTAETIVFSCIAMVLPPIQGSTNTGFISTRFVGLTGRNLAVDAGLAVKSAQKQP
jgi:hypothetical protein